MGRRVASIILSFLFILSIIGINTTFVNAANELKIEQVYINAPEIKTYCTGIDSQSEVEGYIGNDKLKLDSIEPFADSGEGVYYYILLDASASINEAYFEDIKSSIIDFKKNLGDKDKLVLMTFGDDVKVVSESSDDYQTFSNKVKAIDNNGQTTLLFQCIDEMSLLAEKVTPDQSKRRVAIVISDGEDVAKGKATSTEALTTLKDVGVPVYAMAMENSSTENTNSFGEFARNSGGNIEIFSQTGSKKAISNIKEYINSCYVVSFLAKNNIVSNAYVTFTMKIPSSNTTKTVEVMQNRWVKDTVAPTITSIVKKSKTQIEVVFSEDVAGADTAANYTIKVKGKNLVADSASYSNEDGYVATLSFKEDLIKGEYTIECKNIYDNTMEKNQLTEKMSSSLDGKLKNAFTDIVTSWWFILIVVVLIVLGVVLILYKKIKKNKGIVFVDGKATLASEVDIKQHIATSSAKGKHIFLTIKNTKGEKPKLVEADINGSLIIGRSDLSDIFFDDDKMSRQHFCLEADGDNVYISDLDTTNGTSVNGVTINKKRKLEPEDEISAGSVILTIRW